MHAKRQEIVYGVIFIIGFIFGIFAYNINPFKENTTTTTKFLERHKSDSKLFFTNPLLECTTDQDSVHKELRSFKSKIIELTDKQIASGKASHISVYFRDLNNGPWFGINEKENFSPGSLLKTALMMAALKQTETNPNFLQSTVVYNGGHGNESMEIKPSDTMDIGQRYTIEEVTYRMIVFSDNDAKDLLLSRMDGKILKSIYTDLGITEPTVSKNDDFINIKEYAGFFRVLFNASYLPRALSEIALKVLSETAFLDGLRAGVPSTIPVSHKFGEREYLGHKQLHDCGVVYYPKHPYLICVMTRGTDLNVLAQNIATISKVVYQEVDAQVRVDR